MVVTEIDRDNVNGSPTLESKQIKQQLQPPTYEQPIDPFHHILASIYADRVAPLLFISKNIIGDISFTVYQVTISTRGSITYERYL
jgi:hypothetical protein